MIIQHEINSNGNIIQDEMITDDNIIQERRRHRTI